MFEIKENCIVIPKPGYDTFSIPVNKCDSYEKILGVVHQLTGNSWVTKDVIGNFVSTALGYHKLDSPKF